MKRIVIAIECLDYNYIKSIELPNIEKLDPHPAVSFGVGSRPAAAALMGGMFPVCQIPDCHHRTTKDKWSNPWFLTTMREKTEKQFYLCANGWIIEILLPWMDAEQRKLNFYWHDRHEQLPAKEMTDYFIKNVQETKSFFAYLHFFESHWPFYSPQGHGEGHREDALKFLDGQVGRILNNFSDAEIVVTSDHNIPPHKVSAAYDVPSPSTMLSFIATNFKETKSWAEMGIDAYKLAKKVWTEKE